MAVRYPGPHAAVDVAGKTVERGKAESFDTETEKQLIKQGWKPVKED